MYGTCVRNCYDYDKCTFNSALNDIFLNHTFNTQKTHKRIYLSLTRIFPYCVILVTYHFHKLQRGLYGMHKNSVTISSKAFPCVKCWVHVNVPQNIKNLYVEKTTQIYTSIFWIVVR